VQIVKPLERDRIRELLETAFPNATSVIGDRDYCLITEDSLLLKAGGLLKTYKRWGLAYSRNFDCEDFAQAFIVECKRAHGMTHSNKAEGIALGEVWYRDPKLGPHCLSWFLTRDLDFKFVEPQEAVVRKLTKKERESAWHVAC